MDTWENPRLRGRAFVDALASLGDTLEDGLCANACSKALLDILDNASIEGRAFVDALECLDKISEAGVCRHA